MKTTTLLLLFIATTFFGQTMTEKRIEKYVNTIDSLKKKNSLQKISYPDMVACGGALYGYYQNEKLVLIDAQYQAELGFSSRTIYLMDTIFVKIIYREYFAEWGKYFNKYPSDKYEWDPTKMTYTDTLYSITLCKPPLFVKKAQTKIINKTEDQKLLQALISCGNEMKKQLEKINH
jgi:hypothetical protein